MLVNGALRAHLHETVAAKAHARAQVVCARQVPVQRRGVELGEHVNLGDARVDAVGHGDVNQPVRAADGHRRLGARLCERVQPRACPPSQDDCCAKRATASALSYFTIRNKEVGSRKNLTSASSSPAGCEDARHFLIHACFVPSILEAHLQSRKTLNEPSCSPAGASR